MKFEDFKHKVFMQQFWNRMDEDNHKLKTQDTEIKQAFQAIQTSINHQAKKVKYLTMKSDQGKVWLLSKARD